MQQLKVNFKQLYRNCILNDWILVIPIETHNDPDWWKSHILTNAFSRHEFLNLNSEKVLVGNGEIWLEKSLVKSRIIKDEIMDVMGSHILVVYIQKPLVNLNQEEKEKNLETILKKLENSDAILGNLSNLVSLFNDSAIELNNLSIIQSQVKKLIQNSLQILQELDESSLNLILKDYCLEWDDFYQMVETWVIEHVYEILFYKISHFHKGLDQEFSLNLMEMAHLEPTSLGLSFTISINRAVQELKSLTVLRTPAEKLRCLIKTLRLLSTQNEIVVNTDTLIPLIVLALVKSKVLFLYSNWFYIKTFTFEQDLNSGEGGYALLTFEAVMTFIKNQKEHLVRLSQKVKEFFIAIESNDLKEFKDKCTNFTQNDWKYMRNSDGQTCMHVAARKNLKNILQITKDYDWNVYDYSGNTPLHLAVWNSQLQSVEYLITVAYLDSRNFDLEAPIHLAAKKGDIKVLELLINSKCDLCAGDKFGNTPIFFADMSSIALFLSNDSDINHRNDSGTTPFLYYIHQGKVELAQYCLTIPALKVDVCDSGLRNCLHLCCFRGYISLIKDIIALNKLDITAQTRRGNTLLHAAVEGGFIEIVNLLLSLGADPNIRNIQGRSPSDISRDDEIKSVLADHTIFLRHSYFVGDHVARVVVANEKSANSGLRFIVKSGQLEDMNSINTVTRSLKDFIYFRNQLMIEFPEAAL